MEPEREVHSIGHGHVFDDPKKKAEMIALRLQGYPYGDIARKYNVDHTTIIYHCRVAGLLIFSDPFIRDEMLAKIAAGESTVKVAEFYNCLPSVVESWCRRSGMKGVASTAIKIHLFPPAPRKHTGGRPKKPLTEAQQYKAFEKSRPGWRRDEKGDWICLGKSQRQAKRDVKDRARRTLEKRRLEMLTY